MAFWGWRAAAAVRLWGRVVERAEAGGGVGPFQACGCRLVLGGRDDVSAGLRGSHGARGEPLDPARPLQRPPRPEVPRVFRRQPRAAAPGFFFSSIKGGRRPISFSVGASSVVGSGGNSDKGKLSLQDVAELIRARACQRVVVMVGAGISTPSGIPDFRSPGSGLYSNLQQYHLPYPEAIFELPFFFHNPKPFFTLAKELYPGNYKPNVTHYFLRLLHDKGLLLRLYTQNIDGLERVSGIPASKLVEAHGTFASATCTVCRRPFPGEDIRVEPFASLTEAVRSSVPRLLINRDLVGPLAWHPRSRDVAQLGDVVHGVERLVELLGWTEEMRDLVQRETGKLDGPDK
ncbi:NAD-dependent protein deacetylase sirtuin-3, mitochondrial isoform X4 [Symphalangus syndactylus]|uniref:NAD-dependent protein deacetylase sirtuin-3, mitochondrial isoform X4 n=1 Tax=Symphalangus syndactylus TaxID=9590 RepID=UPI002442ED08|nr:NAD-dependent protein deacetylase sirtuin-3, mitochondrial isoform X4 [Symphalangus syndactylus]